MKNKSLNLAMAMAVMVAVCMLFVSCPNGTEILGSGPPYQIGSTGPAGGLVFYENPDYATDGWKYLEAAPSDIALDGDYLHIFGYCRSTPGGDNLTVGTRTAVGTGEANTANLVESMGSSGINAYTQSTGTETTVSYAANICANYTEGGYDDWFLPSISELDLMYVNLKSKGLGSFSSSRYYWSSSEHDGYYAWFRYFGPGGFHHVSHQYFDFRVRPVRAF